MAAAGGGARLVGEGIAVRAELLLAERLGLHDRHACVRPRRHHTLVVAQRIHNIVRLLQLLHVLLRLDL